MADDNTDMPVNDRHIPRETLRQIQQLNKTMESLAQYQMGLASPTQQLRFEADHRAVAARQQSAQAPPPTPPPPPAPPGGGGPPAPPPTPPGAGGYAGDEGDEWRRVAAPGEVSFRKRLQEGQRTRGEGAGFSKGFLNPKFKGENEPVGGAQTPSAYPPGHEPGVTSTTPSPISVMHGDERPSPIIPGHTVGEVQTMETTRTPIPQFGEWQLDTYLEMARNAAGRFAARNAAEHEEKLTRSGRMAANTAGYLNYAQSYAAGARLLYGHARRGVEFLHDAQQQGRELGYSPQDGALGPSHIFGFRNPLSDLTSSAGRQGLGIRFDAMEMSRLGTGISSDQAKNLYGVAASQGWSNQQSGFLGLSTSGDLHTLVSQVGAPLVKQGMKEDVAAGFFNALRHGNASMEGLNKTLEGLGTVAHSTRLTIDQVAESMQGFAKNQENLGASQAQGLAAAKSWMGTTGLPAETLSKVQENPLYQGLALRHGILPQAIGTLTPGTQNQLGMQTLEMTMGMTKGLGSKPTFETIDGKKVEVGNAEDAHIAMAASFAGYTPEEAKRLIRNKKVITETNQVEKLLGSDDTKGWMNERRQAEQQAKTHTHGKLTDQQMHALETGEGTGAGIGWQDIRKHLYEGKVLPTWDVKKLDKEDPKTREKDLHDMLNKRSEERIQGTGTTVHVKFTGAAAKIFEEVPIKPAKAEQNAGGTLLSQAGGAALQGIETVGGNPITNAIANAFLPG